MLTNLSSFHKEQIKHFDIKNGHFKKLLQHRINHKLIFDSDILELFEKTRRNISTLARITFMSSSEKHSVLNVFFKITLQVALLSDIRQSS